MHICRKGKVENNKISNLYVVERVMEEMWVSMTLPGVYFFGIVSNFDSMLIPCLFKG